MLLFGIELITLGSVAADLKPKFQLDEIGSGILFSILPIGILIGSVIFGPIADRFGYKWLLVFSSLGFFIGYEGIAFSTSLDLLRVSIFIIGLCGGIINGATNAVVSDISTEAKGANLSLLGVFFGIGALGMPFVLGFLRSTYSFETIIIWTGGLIALACVFYAAIQFPPSKKAQGFPLAGSRGIFKEWFLVLVGLFLFCQSSYEALINNWTTNYLSNHLKIEKQDALYALSLSVAGLTLMRFLIGTIFRKIKWQIMLIISFLLLLFGNLLLKFAGNYSVAVAGLISLGMGLAGGFPIILGIVGERYAERSGTAFSFVLLFALTGNILVNYLMGLIAKSSGIYQLSNIIFLELGVLLCLFVLIFFQLKRRRE
ncbi:MAG TPA: MFS transporter [Chitinophagaceae bacterium]|nr:MFS transporter [Chitinophagaceae bacterium]